MIRLFKHATLFVSLIFLPLAISACGGGSGVSFTGTIGEEGQRLRVMSPAEGTAFHAGDQVLLSFALDNFTLAAPFDARRVARNHMIFYHHIDPNTVDIDALSEAAHAAGLLEHDHDQHAHSDHSHADDGHSHDESSMHGHAREGHYHIYLNGAQGSDPRVTAWSNELVYTLPMHLEVGMHSLRIELSDNNHVKVGAETIFMFEIVAD